VYVIRFSRKTSSSSNMDIECIIISVGHRGLHIICYMEITITNKQACRGDPVNSTVASGVKDSRDKISFYMASLLRTDHGLLKSKVDSCACSLHACHYYSKDK